MNEALTILTVRVDDIPLLLAQMQRMGIACLLDEHFPTPDNRAGLSLGMVTTIWLTHVHAPADHRMNRVQSWAERRLETVRGCSDIRLQVHDLADDRLADVLRHLSDDERWRAFEQELSGHLVRVYDLKPSCVRLDSTTASSYGAVSEDGLLQLGHSTDHRPDLPQLKVMLATLDPLGMQLPTIAWVRACLNTVGLLYVGDGKMAALDTRASIQAAGDYSLCPPTNWCETLRPCGKAPSPKAWSSEQEPMSRPTASRKVMKRARTSRRNWSGCRTRGWNAGGFCARRRQHVQRRRLFVLAWDKRRRRWLSWR